MPFFFGYKSFQIPFGMPLIGVFLAPTNGFYNRLWCLSVCRLSSVCSCWGDIVRCEKQTKTDTYSVRGPCAVNWVHVRCTAHAPKGFIGLLHRNKSIYENFFFLVRCTSDRVGCAVFFSSQSSVCLCLSVCAPHNVTVWATLCGAKDRQDRQKDRQMTDNALWEVHVGWVRSLCGAPHLKICTTLGSLKR